MLSSYYTIRIFLIVNSQNLGKNFAYLPVSVICQINYRNAVVSEDKAVSRIDMIYSLKKALKSCLFGSLRNAI